MSENTTPNLQPEVSLPIAPTIGEIDHFRIINKNGQSQKATITQVRELMGIDYSILTEQVVHGEYWMGADGVKRQVYVQTFVGVAPVDDTRMTLIRGIYSAVYVSGFMTTSANDHEPPNIIAGGGMSYYWTYGVTTVLLIHDIGYIYTGQPYWKKRLK